MTDMVCLPDALKDAVYYTPTNQGSEGKVGKRMKDIATIKAIVAQERKKK